MLRPVAATVVFAIAFLAFPAGGAGPALAEDTVFRCGAETVSIGDSRYTVQKVCGKPSRSESVAKGSKDRKKQGFFSRLLSTSYGILEELDHLEGRYIDNANFFALDDFKTVPNEELYSRLLNEFPQWIKSAKQKGILK